MSRVIQAKILESNYHHQNVKAGPSAYGELNAATFLLIEADASEMAGFDPTKPITITQGED